MRRLIALLCAVSAMPWAGCGGDTFTSGNAGAAGSAGSVGSGGSPTGGSNGGGSSGADGRGGSTGTNGSAGSAGSDGNGGSAGTDGSGGSAGTTGGSAGTTGGSAGTTGGSAGTTGGGLGAGGRDGGTVGGSGSGPGGSAGSTGERCQDLLLDVQEKLAAAKVCCPLCGAAIQCFGSVSGVCCPETVNSPNSPQTQSYLVALEKYTTANCATGCPRIPCLITPSNVCQTDGTCL